MHPGDQNPAKRPYQISAVDVVTQSLVVTSADGTCLEPVVPAVLPLFLFHDSRFSSDHGSEFRDQTVVHLCNNSQIERAKSQHHNSNDNGLAARNAVIPKQMGYGYIARHRL